MPALSTLGNDTPSPIPLDVLLSYPSFWKPPVACSFFMKALPVVCKNWSSIEPTGEQLKLYNGLFGASNNWKETLESIKCDMLEEIPANKTEAFTSYRKETNHYEILSKYYERRQHPSGIKYTMREHNLKDAHHSAVTHLFKLIRNIRNHCHDFPPGRKQVLGWFTDKGDLDDARFIEYWTRLFPKLLPFIWLKLHQFHEKNLSLKEFYPKKGNVDNLQSHSGNLSVAAESVVQQLNHSILNDLKQGGLEMRYLRESPAKLILEFRTLPDDLINRIRDKSTLLNIEITNRKMACKWYESTDAGCPPTHRSVSNVTDDMGRVALVIGSSLSDIKARLNVKFKGDIMGRIIIFTKRSDLRRGKQWQSEIEEIAKSIFKVTDVKRLEHPIKYSELVQTCWNEEQIPPEVANEWEIKLYDIGIKFKEIIPSDDEAKIDLLYCLNGATLNTLLRKEALEILKTCCAPNMETLYIGRQMFMLDQINSKIFKNPSHSDIYFVFIDTLSFDKFKTKHHLDNINTIRELDTVPRSSDLVTETSNCNIVLLREGLSCDDDIELLLKEMKQLNIKKNIHILRYLPNDTFKWLGTHGSFTDVADVFHESAREVGLKKEHEFLNDLDAGIFSDKMVFIVDSPGMGKTYLLKSLARQLRKKYSGRFIFVINMATFLKSMTGIVDNVTRHDIISSLVSTVSTNEFEGKLVEHWLNYQHFDKTTLKFEVMFDGLDEISFATKELALKTLKTFHSQMPSVRVWVTLRDHMSETMRKEFGCLGCKLEPFSKENQINFLKSYWLQNLLILDQETYCVDIQELATQLVNVSFSNIEKELAGVPLICRILAEIYQGQVNERNFALQPQKQHSLISIYAELVERKFEVYLREKCKLPSEITNDHFISISARNVMGHCNIYFAICLIFSDEVAKQFESRLLASTNVNEREKLFSAALDHGILQSRSPVSFIHRTSAEFVVARFICLVLSGQCLWMNTEDDLFQDFLWQHVFTTKGDPDVGYTFQYPTLCDFLNLMLKGFDSEVHLSFRPETFKVYVQSRIQNNHYLRNCIENGKLFVAAYNCKHDNIIALLIRLPSQRRASLFVTAILFREFQLCEYLIKTYFDQFGPVAEQTNLKESSDQRDCKLNWDMLNLAKGSCALRSETDFLKNMRKRYASAPAKSEEVNFRPYHFGFGYFYKHPC